MTYDDAAGRRIAVNPLPAAGLGRGGFRAEWGYAEDGSEERAASAQTAVTGAVGGGDR